MQIVEKARGTCPVCNGTTRRAVTEREEKYMVRYWTAPFYDKETNTCECDNCGSQYQFGKASGTVPLREDGTPCHHSYWSREAGRCYTYYQCSKCGDNHYIDSGD